MKPHGFQKLKLGILASSTFKFKFCRFRGMQEKELNMGVRCIYKNWLLGNTIWDHAANLLMLYNE